MVWSDMSLKGEAERRGRERQGQVLKGRSDRGAYGEGSEGF